MTCFRTATVLSAVLAACLSHGHLATESQAVVAYEVPAGTSGNQPGPFGGALGMDFNVNTPITISELGVFDDDSNGLAVPITAYLYNRAAGFNAVPIATIVFPAGTPGTAVDGSRFLPLPAPVTLPAGFQGTIVASGYSTAAELNGNQGTFALGLTTNSGGGALSFVGGGRFGVTPNVFPTTGDGGPANRYAAGTFDFASSEAVAVAVPLQNGTAEFSQTNFSVDFAIDGIQPADPFAQFAGWANNARNNNTAVFETVSDISNPNGSALQFNIVSGGHGTHTLGRFRISVTGDDRSLFADGLDTGGDVTANWTVVDPTNFMSSNPNTTFTELPDGSLLATGPSAVFETYTILGDTFLTNITGIRIEAITDPNLPANFNGGFGPGRASNGNFVLREFSLTAQALQIPEPASVGLLCLAGLGLCRRRRAA